MMRRLAVLLSMAAALSACDTFGGGNGDDLQFDGQSYRASLNADSEIKKNFVVSVQPVSASVDGAREAGRYEATVYCVNRYGRSDIIWKVGPDSPEEALPIANDTLTLEGSCRE